MNVLGKNLSVRGEMGSISGMSQVGVRMSVCVLYSSEPCRNLFKRQLDRTLSEEEKKLGVRGWGYS